MDKSGKMWIDVYRKIDDSKKKMICITEKLEDFKQLKDSYLLNL